MAKKRSSGNATEDGAPEFEAAMGEVESIIERIESGELGLEEAIVAYERGVGLLGRCREALSDAEQKVENLTAKIRSIEDASDERLESSGGGQSADVPGA
ncbi:MAG: exodeoxyribonuclease VII small subunit [Planctomycetota bacterium]